MFVIIRIILPIMEFGRVFRTGFVLVLYGFCPCYRLSLNIIRSNISVRKLLASLEAKILLVSGQFSDFH